MKKHLLLLLFLSLNNFSVADSNEFTERNTMKTICKNIECLSDALNAYEKFYRTTPQRAMAIEVSQVPDRKKLVMKFWSVDHGTPGGEYASYDKRYYNKKIAGQRAVESCNKRKQFTQLKMKSYYAFSQIKHDWGSQKAIGSYIAEKNRNIASNDCRLLFINGNIETAFYNQLMKTPKCQSGYIESSSDPDSCIKIPANAQASGSTWVCNTGYTKTGNSCKKDIVIPANAQASGSTWVCNTGYTKTGKTCTNTAELEKKKLEQERLEEKIRADTIKKIEEVKRVAQEELNKKLSLIPPKTELQNAQDFLDDVEIFISSNPSEFDIMDIAMLKINTKLMIEGVANNEQISSIKSFKEFAKKSYSFTDFEKERQDARNQVELNKIDQVIINLETVMLRLKSLSKDNLKTNSASRLDEKINSSIITISNPKTLSELEDLYEELFLLSSNLETEIQRSIDAKNAEILLVKNLDNELATIDQNINKLKTYLQENFSSIPSELLPLIINNINVLENTSKQTFISKEEELKALLKVNKEISNFRLKNKLITSAEVEAAKKAEIDKKKAEIDKKKAEIDKKKALIVKQSSQIEEGNYSSLLDGTFIKNPKNLPICQPSLAEIDMDTQVWDNCWGTQTWSGDRQSQMCAGNCPITRIREGEYQDFNWNGLGINYYPESIWIEMIKDGKQVGYFLGIEGWGFTQRSECKLLNSIYVDGEWVDSEKTDCNIRELSPIFPTFDCTTSYPFKCDLNVSENFLTTPIEKEYVAIEGARVHEQPFYDSKVVKTIPKGTKVFVISKTETNEWYLIKEIRDNGLGEDIGEKLGYSLVDSFQSMDEITLSNNSAYSDAPGNLLIDAYTYYVIIKKMHQMREGYAVAYINDNEMKKVKNQMGEIEKILVNEYSLDEDLLWDTAMRKYDQDYSMLDLMESSGVYTDAGSSLAKITLLSFGNIAKEVLGSNKTKDF